MFESTKRHHFFLKKTTFGEFTPKWLKKTEGGKLFIQEQKSEDTPGTKPMGHLWTKETPGTLINIIYRASGIFVR